MLNEATQIRQTAQAMRAQRLDGELELLFIDGGSSDGTRGILEQLAADDERIRVLDNPGRRTPNGLNIGLRHARGEFVARMDAHAFYPPDYLARAIERLRRGQAAWVFGPPIPRPAGGWSERVALALGSSLGIGSAKWPRGLAAAGAGLREVEVGPSSGVFAGVWRRSSLEQLGGWNEGWPINQDCELLGRVHAAGGRVVLLPELGAEYVPRDTLAGLARQYFRYGYYREKTARRHPRTLRRLHLAPPALVGVLAMAGAGSGPLRLPARLMASGYFAALGGAALAGARRATPSDAAALPLVLAIMHLSWGLGFLCGMLRFGPPAQGLRAVLGNNRQPENEAR